MCQRTQGMSLKECINIADELMYTGKKQGKNRTIISNEN
jgi:PleD family two-component response regulator